MGGLLAVGRAKSSVVSSVDKARAETLAVGCERAAKWILFLSLTLGAIVVVAFFGHTSLAVGATVTARKQFEKIIRTLNRYDPEGYAELRKQTEQIIEELDERDK